MDLAAPAYSVVLVVGITVSVTAPAMRLHSLISSLRDGASAGFNGDYYSRLQFDRYPRAQTKSSSRDGLIDALVPHLQLPVS